MSDEELRARLAATDPVPPDRPVDPATSPRAHELMERAMTTTTELSPAPADPAGRRRLPRLLAAAAAVVALGVGSAVVLSGDDRVAPEAAPATTLALTAGDPLSIGSCLPFDVAVLRGVPVALAGTVVATDSAKVTLDVSRWYTGGDADQVTVAVPAGQTSAALDGVDLVQGGRYLLTATEGTVNGCGLSGPATPELEKAFGEAFGS